MSDERPATLSLHRGDGTAGKHLVSLKIVKRPTKCDHLNVLVDEVLWRIECGDCGEQMDPIAYLVRLAKKEVVAEYRLTELNRAVEETRTKLRAKCVHCGQFTPIKR